jgi:hypothetical protein
VPDANEQREVVQDPVIEDPDERVRRTDPAGVRTGWGRPLLIIAILGVILIAIRLFVMLVS